MSSINGKKKVDKMNMNRFSYEIVLPILYCLTLWSISFEVAPCFLITRSVSGVGSSPALATCETSQVLPAGVPGGFSRGSPVFAPPIDWPVSYELK